MAYHALKIGTKALFGGVRVILLGYHVNENYLYCDSRHYVRDTIFGRLLAAYVRAWHSGLSFRLRAKEAKVLRVAAGEAFPKYSLTYNIGRTMLWISQRTSHAPSYCFEDCSVKQD